MQDELWIIDVSQAVDLDHPRALDFLKEDASHINAFFRRAGIAVLTTRQLFDFSVDPSINESNLHEAVQTLQQLAVRYRPCWCAHHCRAASTKKGHDCMATASNIKSCWHDTDANKTRHSCTQVASCQHMGKQTEALMYARCISCTYRQVECKQL